MTHNEFHHILDSIAMLSPQQMRQLREELDGKLATSADDQRPALSEEEAGDQDLQRRLFEAGVVHEIKPARRIATGTDQFRPVSVEGEALSETIIRERR
jgi:hypothetical protein